MTTTAQITIVIGGTTYHAGIVRNPAHDASEFAGRVGGDVANIIASHLGPFEEARS